MTERSNDTAETLSERAKGALERVCSGVGLEPPARYYSCNFVDHVNDLEFHGLAGVERSVSLYRQLLADVSIAVEEQVVDGARVTSRITISGTSFGRRVRFNGITISRFEDGMIAEDWSVVDMLGMLRQLGLLRAAVAAFRAWSALAGAS